MSEAALGLDALIDALGIESPRVRGELYDEPERAARVLAYAADRPGLRSPAGYAIAQFRSGFDPARAASDLREPEVRLSVEELEGALAWARAQGSAPADCIPAIEFELELARYREDELEAARGEAARGTARSHSRE